jgi:hypothetical protein
MTRSIRTVAALGAAGALLMATPALAAAPPKKVGTKINMAKGSIGALKIGMSPGKARALMGRPNDADRQGYSGKSVNMTMSYPQYGLVLDFWRGTQGGTPKLGMISIQSAQYKANGVGIGNTIAQFQQALGTSVRCWSASQVGGPLCSYQHGKARASFTTKSKTVIQISLGG